MQLCNALAPSWNRILNLVRILDPHGNNNDNDNNNNNNSIDIKHLLSQALYWK